jgi:protein phosphatase
MRDAIHPRSASIDQRRDGGPFDIIGDVHGCASELETLLGRLGYERGTDEVWRSTAGRTAVFIGDLADRGPRNADALRLVMRMVAAGVAFCVPGNHDGQLMGYLAGEAVPVVWGLDVTLAELDREPPAFREDVRVFFDSLKSHYVFDDGRLVVAHTGLPESLHGVDTPDVWQLAVYGGTGDLEPGDLEKRHPWITAYEGRAAVIYGHTRILEPVWLNNTIDIDTGCVYGWRLTALQWPERRLVQVPAEAIHFPSTKPFLPSGYREIGVSGYRDALAD